MSAVIRCVEKPAREGWRIDKEAVSRALLILLDEQGTARDPVRPLNVKLSNGGNAAARRRRVLGSTNLDPFSGEFGEWVVKVSRYIPAERASEVLWHELTHVAQGTRYGWREFCAQYALFSGFTGGSAKYRRNPFEREAQKNETANLFPLVVPA